MSISYTLVLLLLAVILLPITIGIYLKSKQESSPADPRRGLTPNATNYNINGMLSEEEIASASKRDIKEIIDKADRGELPSLSRRDFYLLSERLKVIDGNK